MIVFTPFFLPNKYKYKNISTSIRNDLIMYAPACIVISILTDDEDVVEKYEHCAFSSSQEVEKDSERSRNHYQL